MTSSSSDSPVNPTEQADAETFHDLKLPASLLQATDALGFDTVTEIQGLSLPLIVSGCDIAAQAQTGTGKTAAFLLGSFARLMEDHGGERRRDQPRMLVIAPTRELAIQIKKDADDLGRHTDLRIAVVYGGIDYEKQRRVLAEGVDVLIGTPGRLIDYFKQKIFDLKKLQIVVLDEADRMFDLGFIADIRYLLRRMPPPGERLSMLFSATLSHRVMELAYEHMDNPRAIQTESTGVTAEGVRQSLYQPATEEKIPLLLGLLKQWQPARAIVFVNTKRAAEQVEGFLLGNGFGCGMLSGDVRQSKRQKILADFTAGRLPLLIATDVAARGLHVDDVSHVFNYDLPQQCEDYVHRIGRTARAGTQGIAVSFACENYSFSLPEIQDYIGQSIPLEMITDELLIEPRPAKRLRRERVGADRGSGNKRKGKPGSGRGRRQNDKAREPMNDERQSDDSLTDSQSSPQEGKQARAEEGGQPTRRRRPRRRRAAANQTNSQPPAESVSGDTAQPSTGSDAASVDNAEASSLASPKPSKRRRRRRQGTQSAAKPSAEATNASHDDAASDGSAANSATGTDSAND